MTHCSPQSWSNRRILGALALLIVCAIGVVLATRSTLATITFALLYLTFEWGGVVWWRRRALAGCVVHVSLRTPEVRELVTVGAVIEFKLRLCCDCHIGHVLLLPVIPNGAQAHGYEACRVQSAAEPEHHVVFRLRVLRPGVLVFPGIVMRTCSPLRLFSRASLLYNRQVLQVVPDYFSESDPTLARLLTPSRRAGAVRHAVIRKQGTDFHELRDYVPPDPMKRIDWKASARLQRLLVREFEAPRDYAIQVILDGSTDLTHGEQMRGGFPNIARLTARLAFLAHANRYSFRLLVYDETGVRESTMKHHTMGFVKILNAFVHMPDVALQRTHARLDESAARDALAQWWQRVNRKWGVRSNHRSLKEFADRYLSTQLTEHHAQARLLIDFTPDLLLNRAARCEACGGTVFADEATCSRCEHDMGIAGLTARAHAALEAIMRAMQRSRGRETFVFASAFGGGESNRVIIDSLRQAAQGHRIVHVIDPAHVRMEDAQPVAPGSLGNFPTAAESLENLNRMSRVAAHEVFRRDLRAAGVELHTLENEEELDQILLKILYEEVLAA